MTTPVTDSPVLSIRNLSIGFRAGGKVAPAVRDVSLDVGVGETVAIVGESGSGKSTTAAAVNGLLPDNAVITSGSIRLRRQRYPRADREAAHRRAWRGDRAGAAGPDEQPQSAHADRPTDR
jgi:ABC-type glutathione transport system ATPase component